jgi:plastocyanin
MGDKPTARPWPDLGRVGVVRAALVVAVAAASAAAACAPRPTPAVQEVRIRAFQFAPAVDTVQVGDTVVWTNEDVVPHTASALQKRFDSGGIEHDHAWRHVALAPGTFPYECTFHPTMRGTLVVR